MFNHRFGLYLLRRWSSLSRRVLAFGLLPSLAVASISIAVIEFFPHDPNIQMFHLFGMGKSPWPIVLVGSLAVAGLVSAYALLFPEIRSASVTHATPPANILEAVLRVLDPDERRVVETIARTGGRTFQKNLHRGTLLSRVKIHRVVRRLERRGLVTIRSVGWTNEILLAGWLLKA